MLRIDDVKICKCGLPYNTEGDQCCWCDYLSGLISIEKYNNA